MFTQYYGSGTHTLSTEIAFEHTGGVTESAVKSWIGQIFGERFNPTMDVETEWIYAYLHPRKINLDKEDPRSVREKEVEHFDDGMRNFRRLVQVFGWYEHLFAENAEDGASRNYTEYVTLFANDQGPDQDTGRSLLQGRNPQRALLIRDLLAT